MRAHLRPTLSVEGKQRGGRESVEGPPNASVAPAAGPLKCPAGSSSRSRDTVHSAALALMTGARIVQGQGQSLGLLLAWITLRQGFFTPKGVIAEFASTGRKPNRFFSVFHTYTEGGAPAVVDGCESTAAEHDLFLPQYLQDTHCTVCST